jgi:NAD(P)H-flavin reductase
MYMRQQMYSKGMAEELNGFDTAIKMFAASKDNEQSNTNKPKVKAEGFWKKHKGKILAGAALAAAAGTGMWGLKQKNRADRAEDNFANMTSAYMNAATQNLGYQNAIEALQAQLDKVQLEYANASNKDAKEKEQLNEQIKNLKSSISQLRQAAQTEKARANAAATQKKTEEQRTEEAFKHKQGSGHGSLSTSPYDQPYVDPEPAHYVKL